MLQMSLNSCFHLPENHYACSMCALDAYSKRTNEFLFVNSLVFNTAKLQFTVVSFCLAAIFSRQYKAFSQLTAVFFFNNRKPSTNILIAGVIYHISCSCDSDRCDSDSIQGRDWLSLHR